LPPGLKLDKLYETYADLTDVTTPVGVMKVGVADGKTLIGHLVTDKTWMIINTDINTMPREDFETILKSLKQD
jgi:hypothetical protein